MKVWVSGECWKFAVPSRAAVRCGPHVVGWTAPHGGAARYRERFIPTSSLVGSLKNQVSGQPHRFRPCRFGTQNVAIGLKGLPVPLVTAIGAAVTKNSQRFRRAACFPTASRSRLSNIGMPIATSTNW